MFYPMSFLDVLITLSNGSFATSVYHKSNFTGLFTNFQSFIPFNNKKDLTMSLLPRYFNISSSYSLFHTEVENFKKIFICNGYPASFIDKCIRLFFKTLTSSPFKSELLIRESLHSSI